MDTIFHITGGLGKHVVASSIINSYKFQYPEKNILVSSAYPDIFKRNPNVIESLNLSKNQYFYKNYIFGKDVEIFAQEPYKETSHILQKKHLIETWCDMIGIPLTRGSSIHINATEEEFILQRLQQYSSKPILVFQPFGGLGNLSYCWARDIHPELAQYIVNALTKKYNILYICNPSNPNLNNCIRIDDRMSPNLLFSILKNSDERILIDSCLQHAAKTFDLHSFVFWTVTSPKTFGYSLHTNIESKSIDKSGTSDSYFFNYEIGGVMEECPFTSYTENYDMGEIDSIIETLIAKR